MALDLLYRMLTINPDSRITVEEALRHPYLQDFQGQMDEPECYSMFDFEFETSLLDGHRDLSKDEVQLYMYQEMLQYRPDQLSGYQYFMTVLSFSIILNFHYYLSCNARTL
jgi:serine/threonine protein kinase